MTSNHLLTSPIPMIKAPAQFADIINFHEFLTVPRAVIVSISLIIIASGLKHALATPIRNLSFSFAST